MRNKWLPIKDYIVDNDVDIFPLTETWLLPDDRDDQISGDLTPDGYSFYHVPRQLGNMFHNVDRPYTTPFGQVVVYL